MIAQLYIIPESFEHNNLYSITEIEFKVKRLSEDIQKINQYSKSNKINVNYTILYPTQFISNYTIEDVLFNPSQLKQLVDRDVINALQNIFQKASNTDITTQEIVETLLPWNDKDTCHGIITFHEIENIPNSNQLIYGIDNWYKFRRHFLGLYPNQETFIEECSIYFPNIFFHENNKSSIRAILANFSVSIVKHLGILNDTFYTYKNRSFNNESKKYETLTIECNLQSPAASKDNNDAKESLTFDFKDDKGDIKEITCYPHLRLSRSDNPNDSQFYFHRIYFHEGKESIQKNKILIGHIGLHRK